jgi:HK97 family phage major capsid protein
VREQLSRLAVDSVPYNFADLVRAVTIGPRTAVEIKALEGASISAGGAMVPSPLVPGLIDALRAQSVCVSLGATTVPMTSRTLDMARVVTDSTPAWRDESAAVADADITFDRVTFTARSMSFCVKASRELVEDAPNLDAELRALFARVGAAELDRVCFNGIGTSSPSSYEPTGLLNLTDVNETDCSGSPDGLADWDPVLDNLGLILNANAPFPGGFAMDPLTFVKLARFKESTTNAPLAAPPVIAGLERRTTTALRAGSPSVGNIVWGNWPWLMIGMRTAIDVRPLVERYADSGQIGFWVWMRADVQCLHPEAFGRLINIASCV